MIVELLNDEDGPHGPLPAGTHIDRPDAFWLLKLGKARPVCETAQLYQAELEQRAADEQRLLEERLLAADRASHAALQKRLAGLSQPGPTTDAKAVTP